MDFWAGRVVLDSVDLLRGLVIVSMALDHATDYFTSVRFDATESFIPWRAPR